MGSMGPQLCCACALAWSERLSPETAAAGQRKMSEMSGRSREPVSYFSPQRFRDLAMKAPLGTLMKLRLVCEKRLKQGPAEGLA